MTKKWRYKLVWTALIILVLYACKSKIYSQETTNKVNELSRKLVNTEDGIWVFEKNLDYSYVLQFSKEENGILFSYNTYNKSAMNWNTNILRYGTFKTDSNEFIINFTSVKGSQFNKSDFSDKALPDSFSIKIEAKINEEKIIVKEHLGKAFYIKNPNYIPKDVEITEYKLLVKQILGKKIFENKEENITIEFTAERPTID